MTAPPSVRERVQQAVMRQFELLAEKENAQQTVSSATAYHNTLKNSTMVAEVQESAGTTRNEARTLAETAYANRMAMAEKPLQRAQAKFNSLESSVRSVRDSAFSNAEQVFQTKLDDAQQEYDMEMATAEAEVHRAKREVTALENTMNQHRDVIKGELGPAVAESLGKLTTTIDA